MRWTTLRTLTMVVVALTTVPAVKVEAQSLVEMAISLTVFVLGPGESGQFLWTDTSQANSGPPPTGGFPSRYYTIALTPTDDTNCSQTVQVQVKTHPGLNLLTVARNGASLRINGEETILSEPCLFANDIRIAYQIGVSPPGLQDSDPSNESGLALQPPTARATRFTIVGPGGDTRAASTGKSWVGIGSNVFFSEAQE